MLSTYDELTDFGLRSATPSWATTAKKASIEKYLERGAIARMEDGALLRAVSAHQSQGTFCWAAWAQRLYFEQGISYLEETYGVNLFGDSTPTDRQDLQLRAVVAVGTVVRGTKVGARTAGGGGGGTDNNPLTPWAGVARQTLGTGVRLRGS